MNPHTISKEVLDSIRQCLLELFWSKNDLFSFLQSVDCPNDTLMFASVNRNEYTKRNLILDVFSRLQKRPDGGVRQFRIMINHLKGWSSFTDSQFGKGGNLDINRAKAAIKQLRELQEKHDEAIKIENKRRIEKEEEAKQKVSLEEQNKNFHLLCKGYDENNREINFQRRGYLLESLLKNIFQKEGLITTEGFSFNIKGEQIDGCVKFEGEHYILEAKWQEKLVATNALYQFSQKVEGKLYGRGIFVSINGYSPESVVALTRGKALRVILIDGADLALVLEGIQSFTEMLDRKIKAAQTMGNIYVNAYDLKEKVSAA